MATITAKTNDKVFSVQKWYGLNEHPDGDTRLRMGEASKIINWRITRDGNLKLRPGQEFIVGLGPEYVLSIGTELREVGVFHAADVLFISDTVSTTANPGALIMTGGDVGNVDSGEVVQPHLKKSNVKPAAAGQLWDNYRKKGFKAISHMYGGNNGK